MNSGKSTALLQAAHNYEERDQHVLLAKPAIDVKGEKAITSRLGVDREVDFLITPDLDLRAEFAARVQAFKQQTGKSIACLLIDEAQFLTREQVDEALEIAVIDDVPVLALTLWGEGRDGYELRRAAAKADEPAATPPTFPTPTAGGYAVPTSARSASSRSSPRTAKARRSGSSWSLRTSGRFCANPSRRLKPVFPWPFQSSEVYDEPSPPPRLPQRRS